MCKDNNEKFAQVGLHEDGAGHEETVQEADDGDGQEASADGVDGGNIQKKLKIRGLNDKDSYEIDCLAPEIFHSRLDMREQKVAEPMFDEQEKEQIIIINKQRKVQENLIEDKRLECKQPVINIYKQAEDDQPHEEGEEAQGDAQHDGGAAGVGEEHAGVRTGHDQLHGQDSDGQAVYGAGEVDDQREEGGGATEDEESHGPTDQGAEVPCGQRENGGGRGLKDSLKRRIKRSAKKRLIGVEPGYVQSTITQFLERFPNLTAGGPSVRLSFGQTNTGGLLKRKSGHIEGPVDKQLKQIKHSLTVIKLPKHD